MDRKLWIIQWLLAALFLFAGVMKFANMEEMRQQTSLPVAFLYFIGVAEVLGAVGLILPWKLQILPRLTPLAAILLAVIMVGAVVVTVQSGKILAALFPAVVGLLCLRVARGRRVPRPA